MKAFTTWTVPVAASLLIHAAMIALVTYRLSISSPDSKQLPTLTVELQAKSPTIISAPRLQKSNPIITAKPTQEPVKTEQPALLAPPDELPQTSTDTPEQSSTRPTTLTANESNQPSLKIQPLNKLTRPPAFLRKIEPAYPAAEQRAGSQAYVLAEVTIDTQGIVLDVKIIKSAGNAFDIAVTDALKKSIFVPGYIGKDAVAVRVLVPFRFNLK